MDEVCVVLAGKITLTETGKDPEVFTTGDVFGIKRGTPVNWTQEPGTRKIFVILGKLRPVTRSRPKKNDSPRFPTLSALVDTTMRTLMAS